MMGKRNRTSLFLILMIAFLLSLLLFTGCKKREKTPPKAGPKAVSATQAEKKPLFVSLSGVVASQPSFTEFTKLLDYISRKLDRPVALLQEKNYQKTIDLIKNGKLDLAFVCGTVYIKAHQESVAELLAVPLVKGEPLYYSYIIVRKDSEINDLAGLKGKTFAFTDPLSNSGRLYPTYLLTTQGTTPEAFFSDFIFTYNHENSIKAVVDNVVDGAAVDSLVFDHLFHHYPLRGTKELKIIWKSPPFGIPPIIVRKGLDPNLKAQLKEIFLNIHKDNEGRRVLKGIMIDKFIEGDDKMYDSIRQIKAALGER